MYSLAVEILISIYGGLLLTVVVGCVATKGRPCNPKAC